MEILIKIALILLAIVQVTRAQPNFAALWGLGALGDLGEGTMGGMSGFNRMSGFNGMSGMDNAPSSGSCPYQAHPNQFKFTQMVNNRLVTQECAPGTLFVLSKCSCDNLPSGGAGAPMPGSNPRMDVSFGGMGGNSLLNALVSQLQGGGSNPRLPEPSVRNKPPPMSNHINGVRPRVSSGIRPDRSSMNVGVNSQQVSSSSSMQYNPGPSTGLTSVVDPAILPDVLPPEIMQILKASSGVNRAPVARNPTQGSARRTSMVRKPAPATTKPTQGSARRTSMVRKPAPATTKPTGVDMSALARSGMPPEVIQMLQRSMGPPPSAGPQQNQKSKIARSGSANPRRVPSPTRATRPRTPSISIPTPTRRSHVKPQAGPRPDPLAALLAGLSPSRSQPSNRRTSSQQSDPMAALMAGMGGSNSRSSTSQSGRGDPMAALMAGMGGSNSRSSTSQSGRGDPMAALMAGMGGGNSRSSTSQSGRGDPMAALMASMGGGSSGTGSNGGALAALLGSSSISGSPSSRGGPLDVNSLTGNVNVAALLGETPGPGLAQNVDMTALFNIQGEMGAGGGMAALAGLNNINILKLQQLDRQGVIDISDLTPAGLAAANAHFGG